VKHVSNELSCIVQFVPEVGSDHLQKLDNLAEEVSAVKVWSRDGPDQFRQEGEEGGDDVGDGEVQHVEVSSSGNHVRSVAEDAGHDAEVAEHGHQNYASHHADLKITTVLRKNINLILNFIQQFVANGESLETVSIITNSN
jgi:hypothetical protein